MSNQALLYNPFNSIQQNNVENNKILKYLEIRFK